MPTLRRRVSSARSVPTLTIRYSVTPARRARVTSTTTRQLHANCALPAHIRLTAQRLAPAARPALPTWTRCLQHAAMRACQGSIRTAAQQSAAIARLAERTWTATRQRLAMLARPAHLHRVELQSASNVLEAKRTQTRPRRRRALSATLVPMRMWASPHVWNAPPGHMTAMAMHPHHVTAVSLGSIRRAASLIASIASQERRTPIRTPPRAVSPAGWDSSQQPRQQCAVTARQARPIPTTLRGRNAWVRRGSATLCCIPTFDFASPPLPPLSRPDPRGT